MKHLSRALLLLVLAAGPAFAGNGTVTVKDGNNVNQTLDTVTDGTGGQGYKIGLCDGTALASCLQIIAGIGQFNVTQILGAVGFPMSDTLANPTNTFAFGSYSLGWDASGNVWRRIQVNTGTGTVKVDGSNSQQPVIVTPSTSQGSTPFHLAGGSLATTNSTSVVATQHALKMLHAINTQASTIGYLRVYNSASAPTCSSTTNAVYSIPVPPGPDGVVLQLPPNGVNFGNGIGYCITGGGADNDNTAAPTGIFVNGAYD